MARQFWCESSVVISVYGPGISQTITTKYPYARIGSLAGADLVLPDTSIASRCLYLHATREGVYGLGLFHRATDETGLSQWLHPDEHLEIGPYRIAARVSPPHPWRQERNLDEPLQSNTPLPVIDVLVRGKPIGAVRMQRRLLLLGRRFPSHVMITDEHLSATHCALYWDSTKLWIVDLLSSGGIWKGGQRIQAAFLHEGKSVRLGRVELRFASLSAEPRAEEATEQPLGRTANEARCEIRMGPPEHDASLPTSSTSLALDDAEVGLDERLHEVNPAQKQLQAEQQKLGREQQEVRLQIQARETELDALRAELDEQRARLAGEKEQLDSARKDLVDERTQFEEATASQARFRESRDRHIQTATESAKRLHEEIEQARETLEQDRLQWVEQRKKEDAELNQRREELQKQQDEIAADREGLEVERAESDRRRADLDRREKTLQVESERKAAAEEEARLAFERERQDLERKRQQLAEQRQSEDADLDRRRTKQQIQQDKINADREGLETERAALEVERAESDRRRTDLDRREKALQTDLQHTDAAHTHATPPPSGPSDGEHADLVYEQVTDRLIALHNKKRRRFLFW